MFPDDGSESGPFGAQGGPGKSRHSKTLYAVVQMAGLPNRGRGVSTRASAIPRFRYHHGAELGASTVAMAALLPTPSRHRGFYRHLHPRPGSHRGPACRIEQERRHRHEQPRASLPVDLRPNRSPHLGRGPLGESRVSEQAGGTVETTDAAVHGRQENPAAGLCVDFQLFVVFKALRNKDWTVSIACTVSLLIKILIVISTGLITLSWTVSTSLSSMPSNCQAQRSPMGFESSAVTVVKALFADRFT